MSGQPNPKDYTSEVMTPAQSVELDRSRTCVSHDSPASLQSLSSLDSQKPSKVYNNLRGPTDPPSSSRGSHLGSTISFIFRDFLKRIAEDMEKRQREAAKTLPPSSPKLEASLLPPQSEAHAGRITLVLDLDATLIDTLHLHEHSYSEPDFIYEGKFILCHFVTWITGPQQAY